jgi:hypothetical protein
MNRASTPPYFCPGPALALSQPLATLLLSLAEIFAVPLDLEASNEETCRILRLARVGGGSRPDPPDPVGPGPRPSRPALPTGWDGEQSAASQAI